MLNLYVYGRLNMIEKNGTDGAGGRAVQPSGGRALRAEFNFCERGW